jgi:hypothetical protein
LALLLAVGFIDLGGVGPEDVLHGLEALRAELVAVAQEQGALELARIGDAAEEVAAMNVLPVPVASESRARGGWGGVLAALRATFSKTARMAASWK